MNHVDAHHHLWHPGAHPQPWLDRPALTPIRRPFTVRDLRLATLGTGVTRTVLVQAVGSAVETEQLLGLRDPLIAGVVGWADLASPELDPARFRGTRLVGLRHGVQAEPDPRWLCRPDVRAGLRALAAEGLTFDLLVRPDQFTAALETVRAVPELTFVLDHLGKPPIASGELEPWASGLRSLAREPNVVAKLSGLITEAAWPQWTVADLRPYADVALSAFGPSRLMYGSDWPVCLLAGTYAQTFSAVDALTAHLTAAERADVFAGTAERVYGLAAQSRALAR
ncbi:amidohydrolase family protein [Amycolatopsis rhabdoformis]|uniref:Amidohydrolase family protein n=1 Tax=Amycolatopsis rhabdoformis TaxID=1448059 RepID=A0ABZ1ILJ0_9PSEU|nr:amidohydrolase family protein [Amycolatopsis rhabdoformis]WSE35113.1 amidohydrolase family protein [Amycolatopsis rhabdoformis]